MKKSHTFFFKYLILKTTLKVEVIYKGGIDRKFTSTIASHPS